MKKRFSLEVILTLRRAQEEAQGLRLKAAKEKLSALYAGLEKLKAEIGLQDKNRQVMGSAFELAAAQRYSENLYRRSETIVQELRRMEVEEATERKNLMKAVMERKKIEKLREIWAAKLAAKEAQIENAELDETARVQFSRSSK